MRSKFEGKRTSNQLSDLGVISTIEFSSLFTTLHSVGAGTRVSVGGEKPLACFEYIALEPKPRVGLEKQRRFD